MDPDFAKYYDHLKEIWNVSGDSSKKTTGFYVQQLNQILEGTIVQKKNEKISIVDEQEVEEFIKSKELDGYKKVDLLFIANNLIQTLTEWNINLPPLSREEKRKIINLKLWFYNNREKLIPYLNIMHLESSSPEPVIRSTSSDQPH